MLWLIPLLNQPRTNRFEFVSPHIRVEITCVANQGHLLLSEQFHVTPVGRGFSNKNVLGVWEDILRKEISEILMEIPSTFAEERQQLLEHYKLCSSQ